MSVRLLADEHIDVRVCHQLRRLGHDVLHLHSLKSNPRDKGPDDAHVLHIACQEDRAVLTDNVKDFKALHESGTHHLGIIACSYDSDWKRKARRINERVRDVLREQGALIGQFVRIASDQ
jgi:predicted nuclease of predicted toxin-antitoxin system